MAFPNSPLDLRLELLVDGTWHRVPTYERDRVQVQTGRRERAAVTDPGSLSITINNRDGAYSPRNPLSPYYGRIGRNTRCRLSVPSVESYLELPGVDGSTASTPDAPALRITGDLDVRWEGEADWYAPGATFLMGRWRTLSDVTALGWHMRLEDGRARFSIFYNGTLNTFVFHTLPSALPRRAALRHTVDVDNGSGGFTIRTYWAPSLDGPWAEFGTFTSGGGPISLNPGVDPLEISPRTQADAVPPRRPVAGRVYRAEVRDGINGALVAAPDFRSRPAGTTSFADPAGRTWAITGTAAIRDRADLFNGEISEWPQHWTPDGADAWVPIEGSGILRRLGQGRKPLQSTLRRRIPSGRPLAYWPMEDGAAAVQAASALDGGAPLKVSGFQFASEGSLPSSEALPVLGDAATLNGTVRGAAAGGWHVEMVYKLDKLPATEQTMLSVHLSPGTGANRVAQVRVRVSTAAIKIEALDGDGAVVAWFQNTGNGRSDFTGVWNRLQVFSSVVGAQTYMTLAWRDVITGVWWYVNSPWTGTPGRITAVRGNWGADFRGMSIGHLSAWDTGGTSPTSPGVTIYEGSDDGYTGETAWARMRRLATEEGLPLARIGGPEPTQQVGPQTVDALLTLLQAAADADGGMLLEDRRRPGLLYRERSSMYSQAPKLVLSYNKAPGLKAPLKPVDDDTTVRNDRTVKRDGGSEGRAVLEAGPLSVQNPPQGIGLYDDSVTLSLYSDEQTEPIAYWRLHLGTHDGPRYPTVRIMLHKAPGLIPAVLALSEGDLVRITDLPAYVGFGTVDLLVEGIRHEARLQEWEVELTCSPGQPWRVGALAVHEDFEDTTYAVTITNGGNLPWTRTSLRSFTGSWSLRSGAIGNNQTSEAIVSVPEGATTLAFAYRVSSEPAGPGFEGDRLTVLADGTQVLRAQGAGVWTRTTIDVTGKSAVTFRYAKDNSGASGEDAAWIDDLIFEGMSPDRVDTDGSQLAAPVSADGTTLVVQAVTGPEWVTSAAYPTDFPFGIRAGGETMTVTGIADAAADTFGRTVASGWGTADTGQAWTTSGGSASDYAVGAGVGGHTMTSTNVSRRSVLAQPSADFDLMADLATSVLSTGSFQSGGLIARAADSNNLYQARLEFTTAQAVILTLRKRVAGTETALATYTTPLTHVAGTFYRLRFQGQGSSLKARVWRVGDPDPEGWQVTATDTDLTAAAEMGVRSILGSTNTNASPVTRYDNFRLLNPQRFTVVRAVNGIVKPHAAGTDVRLAHPIIIAL